MVMTDEELTKFSGEHLLHEFKMFWWTSGAVWYMDGYMRDALVESWLVHLRNLILFFCHERDRDDVIAADFFDNPDDWSLNKSKTLEDARERANKELSHITGARKYVGDPTKGWDVDALFAEIKHLAEMFAAKASHNKLHVKVRELLAASADKVVAVLAGNSQASNVTSRDISTASQTANTGSWRKF
jgi:hypothetical protein